MLNSVTENLNCEPTPSEKLNLQKHGFFISIKLGEGGFGKVYLTERKKNNKISHLACKIIDSSTLNDEDKIKVVEEFKILIKFDHPYIIEVHSIYKRNEKYYIFMRYAEKGDLLEYILKNGSLLEPLAKYWIRQLSLALQYIHTLEIAHRDIKCENILITLSNNIKLADFGFARSTVLSNNDIVVSRTFCGSKSYASPQILLGQSYYPKVADMWSLGCVIYIMINKAFPFNSANIKSMIKQQFRKDYKFRSSIITNYSFEAVSLVADLLEPIEEKRFTVEKVLASKWLTTDTEFQFLNHKEAMALQYAKSKSKSRLLSHKHKKSSVISKHKTPITM